MRVTQTASQGLENTENRICGVFSRTEPMRVTEHWPRLHREVVESPSLEILKTHLDKVLCSLLWVTLLRQGIGWGDPQGSLPTPTMLWFCDLEKLLVRAWAPASFRLGVGCSVVTRTPTVAQCVWLVRGHNLDSGQMRYCLYVRFQGRLRNYEGFKEWLSPVKI